MAKLKLRCPRCKALMDLSTITIGQKVFCPDCGKGIRVPNPDAVKRAYMPAGNKKSPRPVVKPPTAPSGVDLDLSETPGAGVPRLEPSSGGGPTPMDSDDLWGAIDPSDIEEPAQLALEEGDGDGPADQLDRDEDGWVDWKTIRKRRETARRQSGADPAGGEGTEAPRGS